MILAMGSMVDLQHGPDRQSADKFHYLARAVLCEVPVMDDTSLDAVNALVSSPLASDVSGPTQLTHPIQFFMVWYLTTFSDHKRALEHAWGVMARSPPSFSLSASPTHVSFAGPRDQACVYGESRTLATALSYPKPVPQIALRT